MKSKEANVVTFDDVVNFYENNKRLFICYHEAAHAVMCFLMRKKFTYLMYEGSQGECKFWMKKRPFHKNQKVS